MAEKRDYWIKWRPELEACPLFAAVPWEHVVDFLEHCDTRFEYYDKGEQIFYAGEEITAFGIYLNSRPKAEIRHCKERGQSPRYYCPGWVFAELPAFSEANRIPFDVFAKEACDIIFVGTSGFASCSGNIAGLLQVQQNMIRLLARKARLLKRCRIFYERKDLEIGLLKYLERECQLQETNVIYMPIDMDELAEILLCDEDDVVAAFNHLQMQGKLLCLSDGRIEVRWIKDDAEGND